jgi:AraC family transcriptional regulator
VRLLAQGPGWKVEDVVCTSGPGDRRFEEQHTGFTIAIVAAGSFQYRAPSGSRGRVRKELMTAGSLVLGNAGKCFECGHDHREGDRCISFWYSPGYFERLSSEAGRHSRLPDFPTLRLPPLRALSPLIVQACAGLEGAWTPDWEVLGIELAAQTVKLAAGLPPVFDFEPAAEARVTRALRRVESLPDSSLALRSLAREAGLSPYHFLRTFERVTGLTPHQYVLRSRLREAALRLSSGPEKVLDIALDCGFGDVSNFNRAFKAEFGLSPRAYRLKLRSQRAPANLRDLCVAKV